MKKNIKISFVGLCLFTFSCKPEASAPDAVQYSYEIGTSKEEVMLIVKMDNWKLGWRMIENHMNEEINLAEKQFDSLTWVGTNSDPKFFATGLEIKAKLKKDSIVNKHLSIQKEEFLHELCASKYLEKFENCLKKKDEKIENKKLQLELVKMLINDQYIRSNLLVEMLNKYNLKKSEVILDSLGVNTDEQNRKRLKEIIDLYGFPTKKIVGKDGMEAVFYIIQHSDEDKEWQSSQLPLIHNAVKNGAIEGEKYAFLYDRIKINNGEKQLYGTQFSKVDKAKNMAILFETEDIDNLDLRRMEMGLMPVEMYKRYILKMTK